MLTLYVTATMAVPRHNQSLLDFPHSSEDVLYWCLLGLLFQYSGPNVKKEKASICFACCQTPLDSTQKCVSYTQASSQYVLQVS